jgi:hypothetical protein
MVQFLYQPGEPPIPLVGIFGESFKKNSWADYPSYDEAPG